MPPLPHKKLRVKDSHVEESTGEETLTDEGRNAASAGLVYCCSAEKMQKELTQALKAKASSA